MKHLIITITLTALSLSAAAQGYIDPMALIRGAQAAEQDNMRRQQHDLEMQQRQFDQQRQQALFDLEYARKQAETEEYLRKTAERQKQEIEAANRAANQANNKTNRTNNFSSFKTVVEICNAPQSSKTYETCLGFMYGVVENTLFNESSKYYTDCKRINPSPNIGAIINGIISATKNGNVYNGTSLKPSYQVAATTITDITAKCLCKVPNRVRDSVCTEIDQAR